MKTRIEAFIERCALGSRLDSTGLNHDDDALDSLSRALNSMGKHDLAKQVYALYVEAYMIQKEMEHQRALEAQILA